MIRDTLPFMITVIALSGWGCSSETPASSSTISPTSSSGTSPAPSNGTSSASRSGTSPAALSTSDVFDLAGDFSADKNPNGAWCFGTFNHVYSGIPEDLQNLSTYGKLTFTPFITTCGSGELKGWGTMSAGFLGMSAGATAVMKNSGKSPQHSIPARSIGIFPQHGPVVVRWTAPKSGKVNLRAVFVDLTCDAGQPEVWIIQNQEIAKPLHYQKAHYGSGVEGDHLVPGGWNLIRLEKKSSYKGTILIAAKDTLDFVLDPMYSVCIGHSEHPDGNGTDTIGLTAVINYTTDPVTTK